MDFEKYYKIDHDGTYNLHFLNKDKLSVPEIKTIFSEYGKVFSVNVTKDEGGLRFVKYKTLREVICCLKGLQDGSKIQLLPEKSKMNRTDKRDSGQQQTASSYKKTFNNDKQLNSNSIYNGDFSNVEESFTRRGTSETNEPNFCDNSVTNENSRHDKPTLNAFKDHEPRSPFDRRSLSSRQTSTENNSSDTIDYEKYYRLSKDATYTVHFPYKKGLTSDKIIELFSPYGNILSIHSGGVNDGLRFVRFKTLEEIRGCVKGLQNNSLICLLRQKDKIKDEARTTDQKNLNQWQVAGKEDSSPRAFSAGKQFNSNNGNNGQEKFSESGKKPIRDTETLDWDKFGGTNNFSDTASSSSRQGFKFYENEIKRRNTSPRMFNERYSSPGQNSIDKKDYDQVFKKKQRETKFCSSIKTEIDTKMDRNIRISTRDYKMPMLIDGTETKRRESDVTSDTSDGTRNSSKVVFPMHEIIVANIHMKYGVHYILHLFEKYDPISATLVKTISGNNIRYCHIFFKTVQDAVAVEEEFDNFNLSGKNLIVLRTPRVIDEAACK